MALNKENSIFERESLLTGRTQIESSFGSNNDDFEVDSNNILNLKNKTSYWSCSGIAFTSAMPATDSIFHEADAGDIKTSGDNIQILAPVSLPHGAVVTACVVYGDAAATANTWLLNRVGLDAGSGATTMATASVDTEDTTISDATIDNSTYTYFLQVDDMDTNDNVHSARITYTTDYD